MTESEIEKIIALGKDFPNNQDLGKIVRSKMDVNDFIKSNPNDGDLGAKLRRLILENQNKIR